MQQARVKGFTLLEVLIAMAIFSLIGIASTEVMTTVIDSNELSTEQFDRLQNMQRAMLTIERDIAQAMPRAIRIPNQENNNVIMGDQDLFDSQADGLGFVRGGWQNPQLMLRRSTMQAVAYRLYDDQLQRLYGNYVDNVAGHEPKIRVLLEDVSDFQVEFYADTNKDPSQPNSWTERYRGPTLPIAVAITLVHKDFGEIRREFLMPTELN
ncbi:type II secretion system minor pseudopilin GspJ [Aestuariibacter sp. AA17]|uniref:Type II secretion system protein J n=1 Tax=Fluctibacter corallii TaxID=2984329 RepID=A0ABT3AAU8_9ALTE|nr:type II secretion system minor pseudopilin GspJ [Aestuariibacter sp. AA17]MCV2885806.1 type II secretion system minor pseudopilin GspJ [Aestuariibacter sp. AA17]